MSECKKILAFDTALKGCSVGVFDTETEQYSHEKKPGERGQAEILVPMMQGVLQQANIEFNQIDYIVCHKLFFEVTHSFEQSKLNTTNVACFESCARERRHSNGRLSVRCVAKQGRRRSIQRFELDGAAEGICSLCSRSQGPRQEDPNFG